MEFFLQPPKHLLQDISPVRSSFGDWATPERFLTGFPFRQGVRFFREYGIMLLASSFPIDGNENLA
jgi:hypothetical protein